MTTENSAEPLLTLAESVATYMQTKFHACLAHPGAIVPHSDDWTLELLIDCNLAVQVILKALLNRGKHTLLHLGLSIDDP